MIFKGSCVAITTPFNENGINFDAFEKHIEFQIENGTDAIVVIGTTGEPSTMTEEEQSSCVDFMVKTVAGRIPVIAGIGGNNTASCVNKAKKYADFGINGVLSVTPYYNKCSKKGLLAHFETIADASPVPVILYNVPGRTAVNITPDAAKVLCEHENIAAIKEASGDISQIAKTSQLTQGKIDIYSGNDDQIVPVLSVGGIGVISVLANILPKYTHDMTEAFMSGDTQKACKMQLDVIPLVEALFCEVNPIPVKTALNLMGRNMGNFRLPLCEMAEDTRVRLESELEKFSLI